MNTIGSLDQWRPFLATAVATQAEQRVALAIAVAVSLPFVRTPLAEMPAIIPSYETGLFFIDLITVVLLYEQSVRLRSAALLTLASGYLFDALIIVPHALSFPGAFAHRPARRQDANDRLAVLARGLPFLREGLCAAEPPRSGGKFPAAVASGQGGYQRNRGCRRANCSAHTHRHLRPRLAAGDDPRRQRRSASSTPG